MSIKQRTNTKPVKGYRTRALITFHGIMGRNVRKWLEAKKKLSRRSFSDEMYVVLQTAWQAEIAGAKPTTTTAYPREGVE